MVEVEVILLLDISLFSPSFLFICLFLFFFFYQKEAGRWGEIFPSADSFPQLTATAKAGSGASYRSPMWMVGAIFLCFSQANSNKLDWSGAVRSWVNVYTDASITGSGFTCCCNTVLAPLVFKCFICNLEGERLHSISFGNDSMNLILENGQESKK